MAQTIEPTPESLDDVLLASLARISDRAVSLGRQANRELDIDAGRALAAWDNLELAIYDKHNSEAYLDRASEILKGADYVS